MPALWLVSLCLLQQPAANPETSRPKAAPVPRVVALAAPESDSGRYPSLAVGPDGSVHGLWTSRDGGASVLLHARFSDGAWTAPDEVARGPRWFVNWADFPQVCVAADGTVMATWLQRTDEGGYDYAVQYALRGPEAAAWSAPRRLHSHEGSGEHGFVSLLPENDGFRAVWLDGRNTAAAQASGGGAPLVDGHGHGDGAMALYTAHVTRDGSVRDERALDERVCDCCATTVVGLPGGGWGVAYRDRSEDEVRDIGWVTGGGSADGIPADGWRIAACPVNGPHSARNGERVAVAWFTMGVEQRPDCRLAVRGEAGTFGFTLDFDLGNPVGRAAVCAWPDGGFLLAWMEESEEGAWWMARSWSPESGLSEAVRIGAAPGGRASGFLRLAPLADGALAAWTEPREGRILCARLRVPASD